MFLEVAFRMLVSIDIGHWHVPMVNGAQRLITGTCQWPIVRLAQSNVPLINGTFDWSMGYIDHWHGTYTRFIIISNNDPSIQLYGVTSMPKYICSVPVTNHATWSVVRTIDQSDILVAGAEHIFVIQIVSDLKCLYTAVAHVPHRRNPPIPP